jgi:hypothetical protein
MVEPITLAVTMAHGGEETKALRLTPEASAGLIRAFRRNGETVPCPVSSVGRAGD